MRHILQKTILRILLVLLLVGMGWVNLRMAQAEGNNIPPVLFFSDLESGPKTGWGGSVIKGAAVTVWGKNFGTTRDSSYITVNGAQLTQDSDYAEWGVVVNNAQGMQRITFWLNSDCQDGLGQITVTVNGQTSNSLPFTVRPGRIFFVDDTSSNDPGSGTYEDPWRSPASYYNNMAPGDTCYFRQGTYSGIYGYGGTSWSGNFIIHYTKSGTPGNPIAFMGYPSETATFFADSGGDPKKNFQGYEITGPTATKHIVVAKLNLIARTTSVKASSNWRVVGNYCEGVRSGGYAIISSCGDNIKILGNEITGGASGNKLDHAIYPNEGENMEIAWNYIHDNNFDRGPMISNNHDGAYIYNYVFKNYHIHDNIIDVTTYPSRAIGTAECADGSSFYIYNNLIIGGAAGSRQCIYAHSGEVHIWNNSIYGAGGSGGGTIEILRYNMNYMPWPVSIRNNIIYTQTGSDYIYVQPDKGIPAPTVDSNCYYGIGPYTGGDDANMINADPKYVNSSAGDLRLQPDSPCIDKGSSLVSAIVQTDHNGVIRPQGSAYDIGAYEYVPEGASQPVRGDVNGDGLVNVVDVQLAVNQFLGVLPQTQDADLNGDGVVNVIDVQLVVNIILGG